ncbi:MAG: hypothetical protein KF876_09935 [Nitrospira sp.]|nr:hypothetical protein [Nitrospira sp.]MDR4465192.1 hypothetical protein [Nitrospira sp.]MDR4467408.1 hypothetical protein [Nitrospira sp.]
MTWSPIDRIDQALLSLEFAIKLMNYVALGKINKEDLDCGTLVHLPGGNLSFGKSTFHTYDDLIHASENLYSQALAASAVAMETALQGAGIPNNPNDRSDRGRVRSLVYMIRSAFAHDLQVPTWEVRGPYAQKMPVRFGRHDFYIDMKTLDGQPLSLEHFGGPVVFWDLMHEVRAWICEASGL